MTTLIVLLAASLVCSAGIIVALYRYFGRACASDAWPPTAGTLLHAELLSRKADDGPGDVFKLDVRYAYEVDGMRHESTRIGYYFSEWGSVRDEYDGYLRILQESKPLAVFVNPDDPRDAVLVPGALGLGPGMLIALSALIVAAPIAGIFAIWWNFWRE
jgi:hypothetical protein